MLDILSTLYSLHAYKTRPINIPSLKDLDMQLDTPSFGTNEVRYSYPLFRFQPLLTLRQGRQRQILQNHQTTPSSERLHLRHPPANQVALPQGPSVDEG